MIQSGINVVNMSTWGPRGEHHWSDYAAMQTSSYSHDELFTIALDKDILIVPYLESCTSTVAGDPHYDFPIIFPGDPANYDTRIVEFIEDHVNRYIVSPDNPRWPEKWAQAYDQDLNPRYMISIINVASWDPTVTDQTFAEGFDRLADSVFARTGVKVGFSLAVLPDDPPFGTQFRPNPQTTGPYLRNQKSVLSVQCYLPEAFLSIGNEPFILDWKHQFGSRWIASGIPYIQDVTAGYDAHIVFPNVDIYGNNPDWREALETSVQKHRAQGITFNTWNGYTEGYAGMPTNEYGSGTYLWVHDLFTNFLPNNSLHNIPGKIEAEDWSTAAGVETDRCHDDHGGLYVGWLEEGDRIDYDVDIIEDRYYIDLRVGKPNGTTPGQGQIQLDGVPYYTFTVPGTGGWFDWRTIRDEVLLPEGRFRMSLLIDQGDWNINWMKFKTDSVEYYHPIPGKIEAEDYWDTFGGISERQPDVSNEVAMAYLESGDWMEYYVDVQQSDTFLIDFLVSQDAGVPDILGEFYVDNTLLFDLPIPPTGHWQTWTTLTEKAYLTAGIHKIKFLIAKGPFNIHWFEARLSSTALQEYTESDHLLSLSPNPFSTSVQLDLDLQTAGKIRLEVFNASGVLVETVADQFMTPGVHHYTWESDDYPEGIYFCKLTSPSYTRIVKGVKIE
jgi:hypothetical protein